MPFTPSEPVTKPARRQHRPVQCDEKLFQLMGYVADLVFPEFWRQVGLMFPILREGTMISTFFCTRAWAIAGSIALLACGARNALAQTGAVSPGVLEHEALTPPLLFREGWQQPPHTGPLNDENRRITPHAVTNPDLELRLYGTDAHNIQVTEHNGIPDVWTGFTTSPVALTLRHKNAYLDLTGLTRMRWRTRTENLHVLHPVVKLADGTLVGGSATFSSARGDTARCSA